MGPKEKDGMANTVVPDQAEEQSDLGLHCLLRPVCPKIKDHYSISERGLCSRQICGASQRKQPILYTLKKISQMKQQRKVHDNYKPVKFGFLKNAVVLAHVDTDRKLILISNIRY